MFIESSITQKIYCNWWWEVSGINTVDLRHTIIQISVNLTNNVCPEKNVLIIAYSYRSIESDHWNFYSLNQNYLTS